ncbi:MAG: Holliday junction branch migration protein RuvA [Patescibacteria group bacterium]|nr:Holliday junction branch migration protein RuvA [Patescibacteria group bacterium]
MIGKLTGTFAGVSVEGTVLIDVGGVGYAVRVPLSLVQRFAPGATTALYIHTAVRDDAIDLYGFGAEEELAFFKLLTGVSGVGPKTALSILNTADIRGLERAIGLGDGQALHKIYGVGKKTAERIVVELRDKFAAGAAGQKGAPGTDAEVIEALTSLGYRLEESREALKGLGEEGRGDVRARLGAALKRLGRQSCGKK